MSGNATSLFTHSGGIQAIAANAPLSLQAHTDQLEILADQDITILSVNDHIEIKAKEKITLQAGQSSITLEGSNITFACPGNFTVKGSLHSFEGAGRSVPELEALPVGTTTKPPEELELHYHWPDLTPVAGAAYRVTCGDGSVRTGQLDANGYAKLVGLPPGSVKIDYGEDPKPVTLQPVKALKMTDEDLIADLDKSGMDSTSTEMDRLIQQQAGRVV